MSTAVEDGSGYISRRRRRQMETEGSGSSAVADDEAARRREERRREREARRRAREEEEAAEEEKRKADREARRRARRGGDDDEEQRREEERKRREEEARQQQEEEERQRQEEEARRRQEEEEEEERRRLEEEEEERRRLEEDEEEEQRRLAEEEERRRQEEEEEVDAGEEEPEEEESIFDQMSPQKKQGILEGLANEFNRIVDERESKNEVVTTTVSAAELDELDLRVRSNRTQLRKAEELKVNLQKQYKELEVKISLNEKEVTRLRAELKKAEEENELAIKEGRKVVTQRTVTKAGPKKNQWGGFVNVVRKAQSAAWEDKFKAMKAKQKESGGPEPEWMLKAKKAEGSRTITPVKKDKGQPEKDKPAWAQQQVLRGSAKSKAPWEEKEEKREDKPSWASGGLLKKTERGDHIRGAGAEAEREKRRQDWREKLKKSEGVKSHGGGEKRSDEPAFKNIALRSVRKSEADEEE